MADIIDYKIFGDDMQIVEIELDPGEGVRAEIEAMIYMTDGIEVQTSDYGDTYPKPPYMVTGEGFCITTFLYTGQGKGHVAFAAPYPGKIIPLDLSNGSMLCQKDAFLCAARGIGIEVEFTKKLGEGLFSGEGFVLQRLAGDGMAFVHAGGTILERYLAHDESLRVDTGCVVAFSSSVEYELQFIGGFKNVLFGGEGLYLARLTGPGCVYLQSLPFSRLADRISAASRFQSHDKTRMGPGILDKQSSRENQ
jgi:uncharacterized protein (TIGR00266 family)